MKVAIIIPRIEELGPIKSIQALVNSQYKIDNIQIKVFYIDKVVDPKIKMFVPVERLNARNFQFSDYDIIHTNGIRPDFFAFINRKRIKYHISTIRNFVFDDLTFTYNRFVSFIFGNIWLILWKRADRLVCVSKAMKSYYENWFSSSKVEMIYNGISETDNYLLPDDDIINVIHGFHSKGLKVLGCAGIFTKRKGIDQILNMLVPEKEYSLVAIGYGKDLNGLRRFAKKMKISDRCFFCGFKSNAVRYFKYFDIFVIPSRSEGFGRVLIEAVQQRISVVCSDINVFKELFSLDEVTFFKINDSNSLSEAIEEAIKTGSGKTGAAFKRYENNYTDLLMAKHYYELYRSTSISER